MSLARPPLPMFPHPDPYIKVTRWATERPLLFLNALAAAGLWYVFLRSWESIPYIGIWLAFPGLMNLGLVASVRGSAVRLGPDQFPELYARVEELARRLGFRRTPDVYGRRRIQEPYGR
jgi:hypothetical protein